MIGTNIKTLTSTTKKLIDLPYNHCGLDTYIHQMMQLQNRELIIQPTPYNGPIQLMAGATKLCINTNVGILDTMDARLNPDPMIWIIGKGMLFDSGGYNLKTGKHIAGMHVDKAGMVIALAVASYFDSDNVKAWCPVTTNMLHTSNIIPGDIITIGKQRVTVNNTDAEGRLIIAEALTQASIKPNDIVITVATLTGCCEYAVDKATGVLGSPALTSRYLLAAKQSKEYAWTLPMFDYMQKYYKKSPILNAQDKIKAGTSEGAMFIKQFVKYPKNWIHLDIASSAFGDNGKANGVPIKSLIKFIGQLL